MQADSSMRSSDIEKASSSTGDVKSETGVHVVPAKILGPQLFLQRLKTWGVELRGIHPVALEDRTDRRYYNLFLLWFTMSTNLFPIVSGMLGPTVWGLNLRDSCLTILFFNLLCTHIPAYFSTMGPRTGLRQMIQGRYVFGLLLQSLPVVFNLCTMMGYLVMGSVVGGQTLSAITDNKMSYAVGIVIISICALVVSFFGWRVLYYYERFASLPVIFAICVATGYGGSAMSNQADLAPATAAQVLSLGGYVAGYLIPWATLASDFSTYYDPRGSFQRIYWYTYFGLLIPTVPLMCLGAAIGGASLNIPSWNEGFQVGSVGGVLAAMLAPAGGFGKFILVIFAFSPLGNMCGTMYSASLNFQILLPFLIWVPRMVWSCIAAAIFIPIAIVASTSFFVSLENFIGFIAYWSASYVTIAFLEHFVFRRRNVDTYEHAAFEKIKPLPTGISAFIAFGGCWALIVPGMSQVWYVGAIAEKTGDLGFEFAMIASAVLYLPLRAIEVKLRGRF